MAVERGAHVIRTHDVAETRDAALIGKEFSRDRLRERDGEARIEELDITTRREAERHLERRAGDTDIADHSVTRTFEIAGLAATAREQLLSAAAEVAGVAVSDTSDNGLVLIVTPAGVKTLTRQITAETPAVASIVERISERCC